MPDTPDPAAPNPDNEREDKRDLLDELAWMLYERGVLSEVDYPKLSHRQGNLS
jgi:hypothetical protein